MTFEIAGIPYLFKKFDKFEWSQLWTGRLIEFIDGFIAELKTIVSDSFYIGQSMNDHIQIISKLQIIQPNIARHELCPINRLLCLSFKILLKVRAQILLDVTQAGVDHLIIIRQTKDLGILQIDENVVVGLS